MPRHVQQRSCAALLLGTAVAVLCTLNAWNAQFSSTCDTVRADTLRLHVRAASDSVFDQTVKLCVRDAVLAEVDRLSDGISDKQTALQCIARNLPHLQLTALRTLTKLHITAPVRIQLINMYFATTYYASFTLPAGRYDAVRIDIGANERYGKNWWCVLYPSLCLSACSAGYDTPAENDLVFGEHILRFRLVEWWRSRTDAADDRPLLTLETS
jgi:stage II sporulation protein R